MIDKIERTLKYSSQKDSSILKVLIIVVENHYLDTFENVIEIYFDLFSAYTTNFQVTQKSGVWVIHIIKALDPKDTAGKTELIATMTATENDVSETGTATVVIKLPQPQIGGLKFAEAYYQLDYQNDTKVGDIIDFSKLKIDGVTDETKVSVIVEDSKFIKKFWSLQKSYISCSLLLLVQFQIQK